MSSNPSIQVGLAQTILYSLPLIGVRVLYGPIVVLQGIYAKHFGLELTTIAAVILAARLFDAVSDPVIGYLSDRSMEKTGTRKPFVAVGAVLFIVSGYLLYVPPHHVTTTYFAASFIGFYLAWTLFEIPHMAWGAELAFDSKTRSRLYALRATTSYIGVLLFFVVPLLPVFETSEVTPETLRWTAIAVSVLLLPPLYFCIKKVPDGHWMPSRTKESFRVVIASIVANKPLLKFTLAYFFFGAGAGMWFAMLFIFIDSYLGLGERFTLIYLFALIAGMVGTLVWYRLSQWLSKKQAFVVGAVLILVSIASMGLLTPSNTDITLLLLLMVVGFFGFSAMDVFAPSILADIVDYGTWKFGTDRAGIYFSVYMLVFKVSAGIGGALSLVLAGVYGFDPLVTENSAEGIYGLRLATVFVPAVSMLVSIFFLLYLPINTGRHSIIRKRLESREFRAKRDRQILATRI